MIAASSRRRAIQHVSSPTAACSGAVNAGFADQVGVGRSNGREEAYCSGGRSASKIGSSTSIAAVMQTRSRKVERPNGRSLPLAFGMYTLLMGSPDVPRHGFEPLR
jgi:hypothetical protein